MEDIRICLGVNFIIYFYPYFPVHQEQRGKNIAEILKKKLIQYNPEDQIYNNNKKYSKKLSINPGGISIASNINNFNVINDAIKTALNELKINIDVEEQIVLE